jgi:hypothetical protein
MDKLPRIEAATISAPLSDNSENLAMAKWAADMAATLYGYFPPPDVGDPKVLLSGAVKMFASYPAAAVEAVCDPVTGLPATNKWAPNLAEIRLALDAAAAPIYRARAREKQIAEQLADRKPLQITDNRPRPTYEELKARCAAAGLHIGPKGVERVSPAKVREKYGISQEQWDAIPNRA